MDRSDVREMLMLSPIEHELLAVPAEAPQPAVPLRTTLIDLVRAVRAETRDDDEILPVVLYMLNHGSVELTDAPSNDIIGHA